MADMNKEPLLQVRDMEVTFGKGKKKFVAVKSVTFDIYKGETSAWSANPVPVKPP